MVLVIAGSLRDYDLELKCEKYPGIHQQEYDATAVYRTFTIGMQLAIVGQDMEVSKSQALFCVRIS
jgi:hypothetical protein